MVIDVTTGILIFIGTSILTLLAVIFLRNMRSPKRLDRVEAVLPAMARGIMTLQEFALYGDTNGTKAEMEKSHSELSTITTNMMVSQKAKS